LIEVVGKDQFAGATQLELPISSSGLVSLSYTINAARNHLDQSALPSTGKGASEQRERSSGGVGDGLISLVSYTISHYSSVA
jgi:hypothetical protein